VVSAQLVDAVYSYFRMHYNRQAFMHVSALEAEAVKQILSQPLFGAGFFDVSCFAHRLDCRV
jgi:hypothetical protein